MSYFDELFWSKVKTGPECWLYQGAINQSGYGTLNRRGVMKGSHRIAWEQAFGAIPAGMHVLHRCDVRHCCRPSHMFLGTNADNQADKVAKGRHLRGVGIIHAKLDELQVREIRREFRWFSRRKSNAKALAAKHGVGVGAISAIIRGDSWKHVA